MHPNSVTVAVPESSHIGKIVHKRIMGRHKNILLERCLIGRIVLYKQPVRLAVLVHKTTVLFTPSTTFIVDGSKINC